VSRRFYVTRRQLSECSIYCISVKVIRVYLSGAFLAFDSRRGVQSEIQLLFFYFASLKHVRYMGGRIWRCAKDTIRSNAGGNTIDSPAHCLSNWLIVLLQKQMSVRYRTWASPSKSSFTRPTEYGRRRRGSLCAAVIDCHKLKIQ
jgi:hypothetical protein